MTHGNVSAEFKKLVNQTAVIHPNEVLLKIASFMGPADEANPSIPAGWTYFGQFVDHDLTFTKTDGMNARTPIFDLDSLYGQGPASEAHGELYEGPSGNETFKTGNPDNPEGDLFRNLESVAQIPDPRNDENIIIASLQLLFQKFHNRLVSHQGMSFAQAKQTVTWHYQSVVKTDFLPRIVGQNRIDEIEKNGRKIFLPSQIDEVFMPTEFSGACYRFGHSMVREMYSFNDKFNNEPSNANLFFKFKGGRPGKNGHQITDKWTLQGNGNSLLRFFDPSILDPVRDADNRSGKIDTKLASTLFNLEVKRGENNVLAHRNLISGQRLGLANGQQVVSAIRTAGVSVSPLTSAEILSNGAPAEIADNTPLWYYTLIEAEVQNNGACLGDMGGTIVAETIIGLLQSDPHSVVNKTTNWPFKLGDQNTDAVSMIDIIGFVGSA
ncbi:MAG: hypothetical protein HQ483_05920 [Rhodospirillales bacterium]|nr:hypothetical protein [Rhodospirillales bacterium]